MPVKQAGSLDADLLDLDLVVDPDADPFDEDQFLDVLDRLVERRLAARKHTASGGTPAADGRSSPPEKKRQTGIMLQFEVKAGGGPPAGFYRAKFLTVETTEHEEFGTGLKFVFEVSDGDHKGEQATRITSSTPTPKNAAGRMLSGISGETLAPGKSVDLAPFVGKEYLLQVENTANGNGARISTCMPNWSK